jgi:hypothetical protein
VGSSSDRIAIDDAADGGFSDPDSCPYLIEVKRRFRSKAAYQSNSIGVEFRAGMIFSDLHQHAERREASTLGPFVFRVVAVRSLE